MNQTKKRLNIIKLAISITDIETIQLQILKLTPMKMDASIQEIISLLQEGSYVKAQSLITTYIEITPDAIIPRTSHTEHIASQMKEQSVIDEFDLMMTPTIDTATEPRRMDAKDFDMLLRNDEKEDSFFATKSSDSTEPSIEEISKEKEEDNESFFKVEEHTEEVLSQEETAESVITPSEEISIEEISIEEEETTIEGKEETIEESDTIEEETPKEEEIPSKQYPAIPHITQKLIYMEKRYPPHKSSNEKYESVDTLLEQISKEGYNEEEIDEVLATIKKLIVIKESEEASELLYISASTESQFAQFMLARELYTGTLLKRNIEASFSLMNILAEKAYPEALCDLGQFYENGIGTIPDLIKAESLYKEAMEQGIKRAMKHHARLQKQNKGFF
jgi:hypothetical protein